jgi:hypothetical protein
MTPHYVWAKKQRNLKMSQRLVLIELTDRANGERVCFPSFARIADDMEMSQRAVVLAVEYLCQRKLIEKVTNHEERRALLQRAGGSPNARSNVYRVLRPLAESEREDPPAPPDSGQNVRSDPDFPWRDGEADYAAIAQIEAQLDSPGDSSDSDETVQPLHSEPEIESQPATILTVQSVHSEPPAELVVTVQPVHSDVCNPCTRDYATIAHESPIESSSRIPQSFASLTPARAPALARERDPEGFQEFWEAYPPHRGTYGPTLLAYRQALAEGATPAVLLEAVRRFPFETDAERLRWNKHPVNWLREQGWLNRSSKPQVIDPALRAAGLDDNGNLLRPQSLEAQAIAQLAICGGRA